MKLDESEEEVVVKKAPQKSKKKSKASKKKESSDEEDLDVPLSDEEEEIAPPAPVKSKGKKDKKKGKVVESEDDEELSDEPVERPKQEPVKGKKDKKKSKPVESDDEELIDEPVAPPKKEIVEPPKKESPEPPKQEPVPVKESKSKKDKKKFKDIDEPIEAPKKAPEPIKKSVKDDSDDEPLNKYQEPPKVDPVKEIEEKLADTDISGKRMTNKELKKLKKREEYERQQEELLKKGGQGHSSLDSNFTMSQAHKTGGQKAAMEFAVDIKVENFTISAKGNDLFVNANLLIAHGRRYGLVGPNGHGKTTLLRHLANRAFDIPPNIDVLLCEQEVVADDFTAVETVLNADVKRTALLEESKKLEAEIENGNLSVQERLNEVYTELKAIGADSAEPRARRILAGLGFSKSMQNRATKNFSGGWRMRVSLARALFLEPTLLLLDEPSNQ